MNKWEVLKVVLENMIANSTINEAMCYYHVLEEMEEIEGVYNRQKEGLKQLAEREGLE